MATEFTGRIEGPAIFKSVARGKNVSVGFPAAVGPKSIHGRRLGSANGGFDAWIDHGPLPVNELDP